MALFFIYIKLFLYNKDMDLKWENFYWLNKPKDYFIKDNSLFFITNPKTDLWQKTYYNFINDNSAMFLTDIEEKFFSFGFKVSFDYKNRFDQSGAIIYFNSNNWAKCSIEYNNHKDSFLGSVVTKDGYSDWATILIDSSIKEIYYRISKRHQDYLFEYSLDNKDFIQIRIFHLSGENKNTRIGIYSCSPETSSFQSIFSNLKLEECQWKDHDGQPPDEII